MNLAALRYEELSLNTFPSLRTEVYDGWILRFCEGKSRFDSCVLPLYLSTRAYEEKIDSCERKFAAHSLPCIFKMTSNVPSALDQQLEQRGYALTGKTRVLECTRDSFLSNQERRGRKEKQWPKPDCSRRENRLELSISKNGTLLGRGLAVFEEDTAGLYDISVNREYRRKGMGTAICRALMEESFRRGARSIHLQVPASNLEALSLYHSLGFQEIYLYWYRAKEAAARIRNE